MSRPTVRRRVFAGAALLATAIAVGAMAAGEEPRERNAAEAGLPVAAPPVDEPEPLSARDFLAAQGIPVSRGAAAGYVPDGVCASCHADLARSFASVAMSRSFYRPSPSTTVERLGEVYTHEPSQQHFLMEWRGERLLFRRWQLDARGGRVHELEQEVDWVLGSGNHARTYLYRTPSGELWQLPIAWYVEGGWGMAPGFDRPDHEGVLRLVQRECMTCHNAFAEVPAGDDRFGMPHRFPPELPQGIGCQRCHGPGAEHVRRARDPLAPLESLAAAVVNPARLSPERRKDVCYQCHLQPSVALPAVRTFARGELSFRPGEALSAHRVELDPVEEGQPREARFEINHHPYRLEQSPCFLRSGGALTCLTCHDPHRKPSLPERLAHYRAVCLDCHRVEQCPQAGHGGGTEAGAATLPVDPTHAGGPGAAKAGSAGAAPGEAAPAGAAGAAGAASSVSAGAAPSGAAPTDAVVRAPADCTGCHMPRRRPTDVVRVTMTDHRIQRPQPGVDLVAPREEHDPVLVDAVFLHPAAAPPGDLGELYRATGVLRAGARRSTVPYLERLLARTPVLEPEPWLRLGEAQLLLGEHARAEAIFQRLLAQVPEVPLVRTGLGIATAGQGRREEAIAHLREGLAIDPQLVEGHFNLGRLLLAWGRPAEAVEELARAVELRPTLPAGWLRLGQAREALGDRAAAIACYRRALAVEPSTTEAHIALARALREAGDPAAAEEAHQLGLRFARRPEEVRATMAAPGLR